MKRAVRGTTLERWLADGARQAGLAPACCQASPRPAEAAPARR